MREGTIIMIDEDQWFIVRDGELVRMGLFDMLDFIEEIEDV